MCGRTDVAEDLTQEVFLRVVRHQDRYEPRDSERGWLFRIARNLLADRGRRLSREPDQVELADATTATATPRHHATLILDLALDRLSALDREVFLLRELGGLGYQEIAASCGMTVAAVRSRIFRARLALRGALAPAAQVKQ